MKAASVTKEMQQRYDAYPRLVEALLKMRAAFAEVNPRPEDYQAATDTHNLLRELGEL